MTQLIHHVIGGGTVSHVAPHFSTSSIARGGAARFIHNELLQMGEQSELHLTKMADESSKMETPDDVALLTAGIVADPRSKIIFFSPAITDFKGTIIGHEGGKYGDKIDSRGGVLTMRLEPVDKIIHHIRETRKDIFLVGFKTTSGATPEQQYMAALDMMKAGHVNLVLANDVTTRLNMVVTPEESFYQQTVDREKALQFLVKMAVARAGLHYTHSMVLPDEPRVSWQDPQIGDNLRDVVNYVVKAGAYKPFRGKTAGHFAARGATCGEFLTSARREDFNQLYEKGLVRVFAKGAHEVVAHAAKPSVGGQSQRIVFDQHPELDNIVHFHCPIRADARDAIPVRPQWMYECGSHECGQNTADGLREVVPSIHAVMLENHGPNIVFGRDVPSEQVIDFIERNFDLEDKTGYLFDETYSRPRASQLVPA